MRLRMLIAITLIAFGAQCAFAGTLSALYLTSGDTQTIFEVQGSSIVTSWTAQNGAEYPVAVSGGTVRTTGSYGGNGATHTLSGTFISANGPSQYGTFDGTTNGTVNFGIDYYTGQVFEANLNWSNPQFLFSASGLGITYDATNNSLWLGGFGFGQICDYSLAGAQLSCFLTPQTAYDQALALDPADGTLWVTQRTLDSTIILDQYSKSGMFLQEISINAGQYQNILGGEFELGQATVPEPASLFLMVTSVLGVGGTIRRKLRK